MHQEINCWRHIFQRTSLRFYIHKKKRYSQNSRRFSFRWNIILTLDLSIGYGVLNHGKNDIQVYLLGLSKNYICWYHCMQQYLNYVFSNLVRQLKFWSVIHWHAISQIQKVSFYTLRVTKKLFARQRNVWRRK